jgi:hypothetical protein
VTGPPTPREIADLLADLPDLDDGFDTEDDRRAWIARKNDLLARIPDAELA